MLNVTEETKLAFLQSSSHKELSITFPDHDLIVGNANIVQESMVKFNILIMENRLVLLLFHFCITILNIYQIDNNTLL